MAAGIEPSGHLRACDVWPGQCADDRLCQPLIARVRQMLGRTGLLYTGHCKMAALATRAEIVARRGLLHDPQTRAEFDAWADKAVESENLESVKLLWDGQRLLGARYEFERQLRAEAAGETAKWTERMQASRSQDLVLQQAKQLAERLGQAEAALLPVTPEPDPGKRQYRDEVALRTAIAEMEAEHRVSGLLRVTWRRKQQSVTRYGAEVRAARVARR